MTTKPDKPLYRAPCNGCGQCCLAVQCPLSVMTFGEREICPALVDAGERYECGLISQPERFFLAGFEAEGAQKAGELLGIGQYCDAVATPADEVVAALYP